MIALRRVIKKILVNTCLSRIYQRFTAVINHLVRLKIFIQQLEGVIESVTHEDAGCWNCVYERQHPARGDFYRRVLQCNGDRDARVVRAS